MQVYYNHEAFFMMKFLFVLLLFCLLHVSREASGLEFGNVRAMFGGEGVVAGRKLELTIPMEPAGRWPGVALIPEGGRAFRFQRLPGVPRGGVQPQRVSRTASGRNRPAQARIRQKRDFPE